VLTGISVRSINQKVAASCWAKSRQTANFISRPRVSSPITISNLFAALPLSLCPFVVFPSAPYCSNYHRTHWRPAFFATHARALWCEWNFPHMVSKQRIWAERDLTGSSSLKSRRRLPNTAARPVGQPAVRSGRGQAPRTFRGSSVGVWGRPPQPLYCCARRAVQLQSASLRKTLGNRDVEKCLRRHTLLSTS